VTTGMITSLLLCIVLGARACRLPTEHFLILDDLEKLIQFIKKLKYIFYITLINLNEINTIFS
jgi:hypothetical protein